MDLQYKRESTQFEGRWAFKDQDLSGFHADPTYSHSNNEMIHAQFSKDISLTSQL